MLQYSTVPQYSDIVQHSIVNTFIISMIQYVFHHTHVSDSPYLITEDSLLQPNTR